MLEFKLGMEKESESMPRSNEGYLVVEREFWFKNIDEDELVTIS